MRIDPVEKSNPPYQKEPGRKRKAFRQAGFWRNLLANLDDSAACLQAWRSGTVTTNPSNWSRTFIWQERREFGRTS
jgi:hypothetical protein